MIPIIASSLFALVLLNEVRLNSIVKGRMGLQSCLKCTQALMAQKGKGKGVIRSAGTACVEPPPKRARVALLESLQQLRLAGESSEAPVLVEESQEADAMHETQASGPAATPAVQASGPAVAALHAVAAVAALPPAAAAAAEGSQGAVVQVTPGVARPKLKSGSGSYNRCMNKFIRRISHPSCPPKYPLSAWLCASFQRYGFLHVALYSFIFSHGSS